MKSKTLFYLAMAFILFSIFSCENKTITQERNTTKPIVVIGFDDGLQNTYDTALPILKKFNYPATIGVITSLVNQVSGVVTWAELDSLKEVYHWEIASHSVSHPHLMELSEEEFRNELKASKDTLASHGFYTDTFIIPYGQMRSDQIPIAREYYENIRFSQDFPNVNPFLRYRLWGIEVHNNTTYTNLRERIDEAIENKEPIIIIFFHDVWDNSDNLYTVSRDKLTEILYIIKEYDFEVMTLEKAVKKVLKIKNYD